MGLSTDNILEAVLARIRELSPQVRGNDLDTARDTVELLASFRAIHSRNDGMRLHERPDDRSPRSQSMLLILIPKHCLPRYGPLISSLARK